MKNRHHSPFTFREKVARMLWAFVEATAFRWTWPTWYRYRAWLLRCFGAEAHRRSRVRRTCRFVCPWNLTLGPDTATGEDVWFYCLGPVQIGARVTLSHGVRLCAGSHDFTDPERMPLTRPPIVIADDVWVATEAFVGPGVTVHAGVVLGARAVAFRDLDAWGVYVGNPARRIKDRLPAQSEASPRGDASSGPLDAVVDPGVRPQE